MASLTVKMGRKECQPVEWNFPEMSQFTHSFTQHVLNVCSVQRHFRHHSGVSAPSIDSPAALREVLDWFACYGMGLGDRSLVCPPLIKLRHTHMSL